MGSQSSSRKKILTLFGTRPEVIKLAPVIQQLERESPKFITVNVTSAQHTDLLYPFVRLFDLRIDYDLQVMTANQSPSQTCSRVLNKLDPILVKESPDMVLLQGDTTTALAGSLAAFHRRIPVGHVEAGLRTDNAYSPYPEEMNRRLITRLANYHFAATPRNRETLLTEGVAPEQIYVTGNPVVDALKTILERCSMNSTVSHLIEATRGFKRIVLTTHRRESFGPAMAANLRVLRQFVESHADVALIFPVHPNPEVRGPAHAILSAHPRIHLTGPLSYEDFVLLLSQAWLIVSDSGGVQEEAPTLGKPLLVIRENTERPEAIESGVAKLVGGCPDRLSDMLEDFHQDGNWALALRSIENPFGRGDSGMRIAQVIDQVLWNGVAA